MLLTTIAALLMLAPEREPYLLGGAKVYKVHNHAYTKLICTIKVTDGGGFGVIDASTCTSLGTFAKAVKITGTHAKVEFFDAAGTVVATGKQKEDGYWFVPTGASEDYYVD
jgi:hypothetical protein